MRSLMRRPVWNTEWTLNAPHARATAPFPCATDLRSDDYRVGVAARLRRVDVMCWAASTLVVEQPCVTWGHMGSRRVAGRVRRVTYADHPSSKIPALHTYVSTRIHAVDESPVISNKRFMWFLLYGGLNVHAVITLK